MKLFYKPGACSLASHITLREIGKDFTLDGVDLAKKRLENGDDYLAVNPKGQVPALLLDDGTLLTEGVAIMQYLADSVPDRQLLAPVSSLARYHSWNGSTILQRNCIKALPRCSALTRRKLLNPPFAPLWKRNFSMWMNRFQTTSGFAASVLPSQTLICLPYCVGPMA